MMSRTEIQIRNGQEDGKYGRIEEALQKLSKRIDMSPIVLPSRRERIRSVADEKETKPAYQSGDYFRSPRKSHSTDSAISAPLLPSKLLRRISHENTVVVDESSVWYKTYTTVEPLPEGVSVARDAEAVKHEFVHILKNIYVDVSPKKKKESDDDAVCTCLPPSKAYTLLERSHGGGVGEYSHEDLESYSRCACGDRCINRLCYCECSPETCPCGEECTNQMFRRRRWLLTLGVRRRYQKLVLFYAEKKGWGIKTATPIARGSFVIEYVGEVISQQESERRREVRHGVSVMIVEAEGPTAHVLHESGSQSAH